MCQGRAHSQGTKSEAAEETASKQDSLVRFQVVVEPASPPLGQRPNCRIFWVHWIMRRLSVSSQDKPKPSPDLCPTFWQRAVGGKFHVILHLFYHSRTLPMLIPIALTRPYVVALDAVLYGGNIVSEPHYTKERKKGGGISYRKYK